MRSKNDWTIAVQENGYVVMPYLQHSGLDHVIDEIIGTANDLNIKLIIENSTNT